MTPHPHQDTRPQFRGRSDIGAPPVVGEAEKPWLRDLLYVRKIILNRFGDGNIDWAAWAIERALMGGADPEELKRMARQAGRFSHWEGDMNDLLLELEG